MEASRVGRRADHGLRKQGGVWREVRETLGASGLGGSDLSPFRVDEPLVPLPALSCPGPFSESLCPRGLLTA